MKKVGVIILLIGLAGLIYFGIEAYNASQNFSALGANVTITKANWTPVIISGLVTVVGLLITSRKKQV